MANVNLEGRESLPDEGLTAATDDAGLLEVLRDLLDDAVAGAASQDPARAQTSVEIRLAAGADGPAPWAVMTLEPGDVSVRPGGGPAEIGLVLTRADLARLLRGELHLPMAIARGDVTFSGPVRKLLRITPILRALARTDPPGASPQELE